MIVENLNVYSVCERITGFEEAVSKGAFEVVKRIETGNDVSGLKQQVAQVLAQNPDLDAIMCGDDQMAEQVREAITEAGQEVLQESNEIMDDFIRRVFEKTDKEEMARLVNYIYQQYDLAKRELEKIRESQKKAKKATDEKD